MLFSSLALGQANADASEFEFAKDEVLRLGETCPEGMRDLGGEGPLRLAFCRPDGFVPIASPLATEAMCDQAVEAGVFGVWFEGDPVSVCLYSLSTSVNGLNCWPATIETTLTSPFSGEVFESCALPVLVKGAQSPAANSTPSLAALCINDDSLLTDDAAADLDVGSIITDRGATNYIITSGQVCGFDCHDGFDINCDGKLGDYCQSEVDRRTVAGAKACIATSNAAD